MTSKPNNYLLYLPPPSCFHGLVNAYYNALPNMYSHIPSPHITLARIHTDAPLEVVCDRLEAMNTEPIPSTYGELDFFGSRNRVGVKICSLGSPSVEDLINEIYQAFPCDEVRTYSNNNPWRKPGRATCPHITIGQVSRKIKQPPNEKQIMNRGGAFTLSEINIHVGDQTSLTCEGKVSLKQPVHNLS